MGRILLNHHGEQEWILQIMEAVKAAVTNGVGRFTQAQLPAVNESPDGQYRFAARTRDELLQSTREAAAAGEVDPRSPFARLRDPAQDLSGTSFQVDEDGQLGQVVQGCAVARDGTKKIITPASNEWSL